MVFRALAAIGLLWGSALAASEPRRIFEDQSFAFGGEVDEAGALHIQLWSPHVRYVVPPETEEKVDELGRILRRASETGRAVTIRYLGTAGRVSRPAGTIRFPVCEIRLDELSFVPSKGCEQAEAAPAGPEADLAYAQALAAAGGTRRAIDLLAPLSFEDAATRKLLLRVRAGAHAGLAAAEVPASPAADTASASALADYVALAALEPDDVEHQFAIGEMLIDLGGYGEAKTLFDHILKRWPEEEYRLFVRYGLLRRVQGDYEGALAALDELVARSGPQDGMRYHYHRGWTLSLLGRHTEAEAEYTKGFAVQADYHAAFIRRGCARASLGRLDEALADFDEARRLLTAMPDPDAPTVQSSLRDLAADRASVATKKAAGGGPVEGMCAAEGWTSYEKPRERSALLPPS